MCNNFHIIPQIFTLFTFLCVVKYELWGHHRRNERRENLLRSKREKKIKNLLISASNNKTPFSIQSRLKKERERDYKNITTLGFFESDVVFIIVMSFCWSFRLFKFILKPPLENLWEGKINFPLAPSVTNRSSIKIQKYTYRERSTMINTAACLFRTLPCHHIKLNFL